jgi:hypothetical protein
MEQTTVRGIANASEFTDAVTYFFDSAYLPILRPYLNEYTPELVFEICLDTGAAGAKLAHLLGACNRLLQENPDNGAFHALRTFAIALLGYSDGDVRDEVDAALESFKKYWNWNRIESHQFLLRLRAQIIAIDSDRAGGVDASIISDHSRWFANFNGTQQPGPTRSQPS